MKETLTEKLYALMNEDSSAGVRSVAARALLRGLQWYPVTEAQSARLYLAQGYWPQTLPPGEEAFHLLMAGLKGKWGIPVDPENLLGVVDRLAEQPVYREECLVALTEFRERARELTLLPRPMETKRQFFNAIELAQRLIDRISAMPPVASPSAVGSGVPEHAPVRRRPGPQPKGDLDAPALVLVALQRRADAGLSNYAEDLIQPKKRGGDQRLYRATLEFSIPLPAKPKRNRVERVSREPRRRGPPPAYPTRKAALAEKKRRTRLKLGVRDKDLDQPRAAGGNRALLDALRKFGESEGRPKYEKYPTPKAMEQALLNRQLQGEGNDATTLNKPVKSGGDPVLYAATLRFGRSLPKRLSRWEKLALSAIVGHQDQTLQASFVLVGEVKVGIARALAVMSRDRLPSRKSMDEVKRALEVLISVSKQIRDLPEPLKTHFAVSGALAQRVALSTLITTPEDLSQATLQSLQLAIKGLHLALGRTLPRDPSRLLRRAG